MPIASIGASSEYQHFPRTSMLLLHQLRRDARHRRSGPSTCPVLTRDRERCINAAKGEHV